MIQTPAPNKAHFIARLKAAQPTEKPLLLAGHEDDGRRRGRRCGRVDPFAGVVARRLDVRARHDGLKGGLAAFTVAAMAARTRRAWRSSAT